MSIEGKCAARVAGAILARAASVGTDTPESSDSCSNCAAAPNYRLYALDTEPPKPGLVRVAEHGATIVGERWLLSPAALGQFLAELPAPMSLGSIELDNGSWITGFGCDHAALAGARDITSYGGWLAFRNPEGSSRP